MNNEKIIQIFIQNMGNKITPELANGMISEILKVDIEGKASDEDKE